MIIWSSIEKNDDEDDDHQYIHLNWGQEKDCNIYVFTKHAYISEQEEQELIKRGYVLHIPIKKKRKKGEEKDDEQKPKAIPNRKKYSAKRWVVECTNSWHNRFRKLFTLYEKKGDNYLGLVQLSCCIIIYKKIILG